MQTSDGPIFCAKFDDGIAVRMSTFAFHNKLDEGLKRGVKLALLAYSSRRDVPLPQIQARIVEGCFEGKDGRTLKTFSLDELAKARASASKGKS